MAKSPVTERKKGETARGLAKRGRRPLRGLITLALLLFALVATISALGAGGESDGYFVRVEFKDSTGINKGADVRIAGANAGTVKRMFVSDRSKASVVLSISDPAFQKFYSDAKCRIRLQSLIGEKFIDCDPGSPTKPELAVDPTDQDRRVMSSSRTSSPVDIDTILNNFREPERERFRVIMSELGITLGGRGGDLNEIIQRFDGTFKEVNDVLRIFAKQNKKLEKLAVDGDVVLKELADNRQHITALFKHADTVQRGVNVRRQELAETWARLPAFLDELEPTARELKNFANASRPIAKAARRSGRDLSTWVSGTADFAESANGGLSRLGDSLDIFRSKIGALTPLAEDLNRFTENRSSITNVKKLLTSFEDQGGYANLASLAIGLVGAANGFDSFGHFMRASLVLQGSCFNFSNLYNPGCSASFDGGRQHPQNREPGTPDPQDDDPASASSPTVSAGAAALNYLLGGER